MNIVPMDTMNGGQEDLIGQDTMIRITIEILESGLYNTDSITVLGVAVRAALTLMIPVTNHGPGSSLRCPVWYIEISTGMILLGRYEAEGQSGITSIAGADHHIHHSLGPSRPRGWQAKRQDPPDPLVAVALTVDPQAVIQSAAAAALAVTGT